MNSQAARRLCSPVGWGFFAQFSNGKTSVGNNKKKFPPTLVGTQTSAVPLTWGIHSI